MGFQGENTRVGCHAVLQEIFSTQGLKPGLPHCRQILYQLSYQGSPVVKNPPSNAGDLRDADSIPGSGRSSEEGMATHSGVLAWKIPWTEEPAGLQSLGSQRVMKRFSMQSYKPTSCIKLKMIALNIYS